MMTIPMLFWSDNVIMIVESREGHPDDLEMIDVADLL